MCSFSFGSVVEVICTVAVALAIGLAPEAQTTKFSTKFVIDYTRFMNPMRMLINSSIVSILPPMIFLKPAMFQIRKMSVLPKQ